MSWACRPSLMNSTLPESRIPSNARRPALARSFELGMVSPESRSLHGRNNGPGRITNGRSKKLGTMAGVS